MTLVKRVYYVIEINAYFDDCDSKRAEIRDTVLSIVSFYVL